MTGIGGQGVQIATKALARAAASQGLNVMFFGMFGGSVRGGRSETTLVVSDEEIEAPPIIPETSAAVAMHDEFFEPVAARLRPDGVAVINSSLFSFERNGARVVRVPMTEIAEELGNVNLVGMVAMGATVSATGLVSLDAALEAMRAEIPSYRADRIPQNEQAIVRGAAAGAIG